MKFRTTFAALLTVFLPFISVQINQVHAKGADTFTQLNGDWRGRGRIALTNGQSRKIACRAYYRAKDRGTTMSLAIRCAATDSKIELRAKLNNHGGRVSGSWEERTFNAEGDVSGAVRTGRVNLAIAGAVNGSMNISFSKSHQRVNISTRNSELKGISIDLRR